MTNIGVIHGRFQVLHNDHMQYLLAGKERCKHLFVGITNPDPSLTREDPADPQRSDPTANPLTYYERYALLRASFEEVGVAQAEFSIVPFPINVTELYKYYVPSDAVFYLTIYDQWGRRKLELFKSVGLKTEVMWDKSPEKKGLTGAEIRRRMIAGEPWEHLGPPAVAVLLRKWDVVGRLRRLRTG